MIPACNNDFLCYASISSIIIIIHIQIHIDMFSF